MVTNDIDLSLREAVGLHGPEQLFVLTDTNTQIHCLPVLLQTLNIMESHILCLPQGEEKKNIETLQHIWNFLLEKGATRASILLILGGGTLTDIGGFAATTFMRGMPYVNIPTTLLGMVDASVGGKTGINYNGVKNLIGAFSMPESIIVYTPFLTSLPAQQFLSGWAEMLKHTLISSPLQLAALQAFDLHNWFVNPNDEQLEQLTELVDRSIEIKRYIVELDPQEQDMRQTLNFGHTIGHALEAFALEKGHVLLHGYAVLYGMVAELYLSHLLFGFSEKDIQIVIACMKEFYGKPDCACSDYDKLIALMHHDKKNQSVNDITFTLLRSIGNYQTGCVCSETQIKEALDFLFNC